MKKILMIIVVFIYTLSDVQGFSGKSYVVIDSVSGTVLESQNEDYVQSVASISKIMTAIIAIENGHLEDKYTIGEEINKAWGSGVYIHIGDKITLQDLLYGLLLRSGNDAALCIAKNIGGSVEHFVEMMNQKAKELNLTNTTFSNPTGLDEEDDGNRSSALDMALLMRYCSFNPIFNDIVSTKVYKRLDTNTLWHNKNKLLTNYKYCVGGKTGYTKKAKRTLVTRAIKDDLSLIIVTFNCGDDFHFHQTTYEQCFKKYQKSLVLSKGIYEYHGHSFLIDKDIYSIQKANVSSIKQEQIEMLSKMTTSNSILQYFMMILGDMFNG